VSEPGSSAADAARILAAAEAVLDRAQVQAAYARMAHDIQAAWPDASPLVLVCMVGGMIPAVELLSRMPMQLEVDYVHATRYRGGISGHDVQWLVAPSRALHERHVLVIDDILDEGHTLAAILNRVRAAGALSVRSAVLVEKCHDRRVPGLAADFVGAQVPDRYVFGCGMDYKGWHRQLPAIYAVAAQQAGQTS
jgi:hypoxanthine phosphoribosyltransferase